MVERTDVAEVGEAVALEGLGGLDEGGLVVTARARLVAVPRVLHECVVCRARAPQFGGGRGVGEQGWGRQVVGRVGAQPLQPMIGVWPTALRLAAATESRAKPVTARMVPD